MKCDRCKADNAAGLTFCHACGYRLAESAPAAQAPLPRAVVIAPEPPRSRPAAPDFDFVPRAGERPPAECICTRCGFGNGATNIHCSSCGASLGPARSLLHKAVDALHGGAAAAPEPHAAASEASAPNAQPEGSAGPVPPAQRKVRSAAGSRPPEDSALSERREGLGALPRLLDPRAQEAAILPAGTGAQPLVGYAAPASPERQDVPTDRPAAREGAPPAPARLVVITQDGSPGRDYVLTEEQVDIGRSEGQILLPHDPYVSPRHARLRRTRGRLCVADLGSTNGIFLRLRSPRELRDGDLALIGLEVLRFEVVSESENRVGIAMEHGTHLFGSPASPRFARLCQRTVEGITRNVYSLERDETVIGRESGDLVFATDPFMSRRHACIDRDPRDGTVTLRDLGSSNGTYLRLREETALEHGDHLRIGQHLFRLELDFFRLELGPQGHSRGQ